MGTLFRPVRASNFPMSGKDESEGVDDDQPVPVVRNRYIYDATGEQLFSSNNKSGRKCVQK